MSRSTSSRSSQFPSQSHSHSRPLPRSSDLPREQPEPSPPSSRSHSIVSRSNSGHSLSSYTSDAYYTPRTTISTDSEREEAMEGKYSLQHQFRSALSLSDHPYNTSPDPHSYSLSSIQEQRSASKSDNSEVNIRINPARKGSNQSGNTLSVASTAPSQISTNQFTASSPAVRRELEAEFFRFARHGHAKELERLIALGVSVNTMDQHGNTILIVAAQNGNKKIAKLALRSGANLNHQNKSGNSSLHYCWAFQYKELAEYLLSKGANPNVKNLLGLTYKEGIEKKSNKISSPSGAANSKDKAEQD